MVKTQAGIAITVYVLVAVLKKDRRTDRTLYKLLLGFTWCEREALSPIVTTRIKQSLMDDYL
jgi:hypothetical protein